MKELEMLLQDSTDASVREYYKSGHFSKKVKQYYSYGNFDNIMLSIKKFDEWIHKSIKGNEITYYRGFLFAPNLQKFSPTLDERRVRNLRINAYEAYNKDLVTLVQKKHGDFDYEYIAVRR